MKNLLLAALFLAASCGTPPEVLPPPFGSDPQHNARLFFPTGIAITPGGALLVANGNFDRRYDAGTVVALSPSFVQSFFLPPVVNCDVPANRPANCDRPIDGSAAAVLIGNYAGPLQLDPSGTLAFTASRDSGILNAVAVDPSGGLSCPAALGLGGSATDCRKGVLNLKQRANLDGPFAIVQGSYAPSGPLDPSTKRPPPPRPVLFVSSVVPHIDSITGGALITSSQVAALDLSDPTQIQVPFTLLVSNVATLGGGTAPGAMAFDPVYRRLYLAGCYQRFGGTGTGEPGSGLCGASSINALRIVNVDAQGAAQTRAHNLYADVHSSTTTQIVLAEPDAMTGAPHALWATMRNADMLVRIDLPQDNSTAPRVTRVVSLGISPADVVRIPRPGAADLFAVTAERSGTMAIYDAGLDQIVGQVDRLGDQPFSLAQFPCPPAAIGGSGSASACLAVTIFNECRVAFVEIPLSAPWTAALRGRAGGCL